MSNDKEKEVKRLEEFLEKNMNQITNKILVLSNKGGVGKSFVAFEKFCELIKVRIKN